MIVYLVRHTDYANPKNILPGRLPVKLSTLGVKQARKLRDFFKDKQINLIYSSAVLRCKQTAKIIANNKIPIKYDKRLLETLSAYQGYWKNDWSYFFGFTKELGGETNQNVQDRMVDFWHNLNFDSNRNLIIISHGDPIYFLYQYLKKQPLIAQDDLNPPKDEYPSKGSVIKIEIVRGKVVNICLPITNDKLK